MAIGKRSKDGVIIKSKTGFNYYHGQSDDGLRLLPEAPRGRIMTLKVFDVVEIANNQISVRIHPNGHIEIEPSL